MQSKTLTRSKWLFVINVSKIYTRRVLEDFEKKVYDCSAFSIDKDPVEGEGYFLVTHTNTSSKITWGQHQFKVRADKDKGEYRCECKEWEHTGMEK